MQHIRTSIRTKQLLFFFIILILPLHCAFADILYLKNGDIIQGQIKVEEEDSIFIMTDKGWKKILVKEIKEIRRYKEIKKGMNVHYNLMDEIQDDIARDKVEGTFGLKAGMFMPRDKIIKQYHSSNFAWGASANIWMKEIISIQFEIENVSHKFSGTIESFDLLGNYQGTVNYSDKLTLTPLWFSFLVRHKKSYLFAGAGFGLMIANRTTVSNTIETVNKGNFNGYQFLTGIMTKKAGLMLKYSVMNTDSFWKSIQLGGTSVFINIYI